MTRPLAADARPLTRLGLAGLGAHVFYELAAGVGMPGASVIGPVPAAGLWAAATVGGMRAARRWPPERDAAFAAVNGLGLAAVLGHLGGWPHRRTRLGLPWLTSCEGMGPERMPGYNAILYVSGAATALALLTENRAAGARWALASVALAPVLSPLQHGEHRRLVRRARQRPGWATRRLVREAA
ncbi:hypothetical protein [Georgenia sp. AZ-5]|uniref:hypothetical protein n=1 Tax=Georgenia sp. AZ-5 TaxID=3367526 RepID=UPI00375463AE